eukprot:scaffold84576_cov27-Tisochrysis_lutea.AAC.2
MALSFNDSSNKLDRLDLSDQQEASKWITNPREPAWKKDNERCDETPFVARTAGCKCILVGEMNGLAYAKHSAALANAQAGRPSKSICEEVNSQINKAMR